MPSTASSSSLILVNKVHIHNICEDFTKSTLFVDPSLSFSLEFFLPRIHICSWFLIQKYFLCVRLLSYFNGHLSSLFGNINYLAFFQKKIRLWTISIKASNKCATSMHLNDVIIFDQFQRFIPKIKLHLILSSGDPDPQ